MKAFNANQAVGSVVGEIRIWNANRNMITRIQDASYNFSCNIYKAYESTFRSVTCCSGSLAAYRRAAIANLIPYWTISVMLTIVC